MRNWLPFKIHLGHLRVWLKDNISDQDGIFATADGFTLVCKTGEWPADQEAAIDAHINSLTAEGEAEKFRREKAQGPAMVWLKTELLTKDLTSLSQLEKKVWLGLPLSANEIDGVVSDYLGTL